VRTTLSYSKITNSPVISWSWYEQQRAFVSKLRQIEECGLAREITNQQSLLAKLKQAILQEAIQGKLTADWRAAHPDVEPASQLLHRIQAEKARLIAAKKLRPEKPLPKITPAEIPFEIPKGWEWCRIGDLIKITGGSQPNKGVFIREPREGYTRFVQIRDFKSDDYRTYIPTNLANRMFTNEDILIGRYGPPVFQILRGLEGTYNVALMKAEPRFGGLINNFLFYLLQEPRIQRIVVKESERTAGQTGVRLPLLNEIIFPLPPLAEEAAIVERVEALMTTCRALETEIEHARTHAAHLLQAVLKEAFAPASA
jgi:type I restriction enzyme S subunit